MMLHENIFDDKSVVYNQVSDITEMVSNSGETLFMKSYIALGLIVYLMFILLSLRNRAVGVYKLFTDYRFAKKRYEEAANASIITPSMLLFTIIVTVTYALTSNMDYMDAAVALLSLIGVMMVQPAFLRISGWLTESESFVGEINFNRPYYLSLLGLVVLPFVLMKLLYSNCQINPLAVLTVAGIVLLLMLVRIIRIFVSSGVSFFVCLLYFCVVEISPYLVLLILFE